MKTSPIYIHLHTGEKVSKVGQSHWFGYPDLPADVEIPTIEEEDGSAYTLTLVCQINLAELPANDALPKEGLLSFFADISYYSGDWDEPAITMQPSDNRVCRVVYTPKEKMGNLVNLQEVYYEQDEPRPIPISFSVERPTLSEPDLQLLGSTQHLEWETWPEPCEGWQLLLQMDSMEGADYNYNFIDFGVLCFIIDPKDLKNHNFSNVKSIILST